MRILIADTLPDTCIEGLQALGLTVDYRPKLTAEELPDAVPGVCVLIVRSTEVRAPVFARGTSLDLVIRAGAGVNTIDVGAASARGIYVANCPGKNSIAVAELVFALLLAIDRRIVENVTDLRAGKWHKTEYSRARGLHGRILGIAGYGGVGREVAERAHAFGMPVVVWSRSLTAEQARAAEVERVASLLELCIRCDVISLHLPLTPETRGIVTDEVLRQLPLGAVLINTARAELVDTAALRRAVQERGLRVGLDVFHEEPAGADGTFADPIVQLPRVYGTHHIGASTEQAQHAIAEEVVNIVQAFVRTGTVPNCVNLCHRSPGRFQMIVHHLDRVGVLARVLAALERHGINVEEVENTIFDGAVAACCTLRLGARPAPEVLDEIRRAEHVMHVDVSEAG
ncbi:MAG TPA: NAD(P)-dependent oxidoreductase [Polyangia bacterium]|jgi:D-3-phosphoglycerate dehydrogenase